MKTYKKGISLIVLVITVIVLAILATTVIISLSNTNIIGKSKEAVEKYNLKQLESAISTQMLISGIVDWNSVSEDEFETQLKSISDAITVQKMAPKTWEVKSGNNSIIISQSGNMDVSVAVWDGETIEVPEINGSEWHVSGGAQLKFIAEYVNNGTLTDELKGVVAESEYDESDIVLDANTVIKLTSNIDMGAKFENGELISGTVWTPIGNRSKKLKATFDGNGHYITGLYVKHNTNFGGFIGVTTEVKNLSISNSYVEIAGGCSGGIVGFVSTVTNCHNFNTIVKQTSSYTLGGVAGQVNASITDCSNSGSVTSVGNFVGGVVGQLNTAVKANNLENNGNVIVNTEGAGGAGGVIGDAYDDCEVRNCNNNGNLTVTVGSDQLAATGGVIGNSRYNSSVANCNNTGEISSNGSNVGGVVGILYESANISECANSGIVSGNWDRVGGIIGGANKSTKVRNCINNGSVHGDTDLVGGIAGILGKLSELSDCKNFGAISGYSEAIGGIVGGANISSSISLCINSGNVDGSQAESSIGGIVGEVATDGLEPSEEQSTKISMCYNTGEIKGGPSNTGGICGYAGQYQSLIEKCYNAGEVQGVNNVAGISGGLARGASVENCYNTKPISGSKYVAGIVGTTNTAGTTTRNITNVYNIGTITGTQYVGGIIGDNTNATITNACYLQGTASVDVGTGTATDWVKDSNYIKTTFLTAANATQTIWEIRSGANNGYPCIIGLK